jgi:hypothetical protein
VPNLISPDYLLQEMSKLMLDGRKPESEDDWIRVVNGIAFNVEASVAGAACQLMRKIYDMPLSEENVDAIVAFQLLERAKRPGATDCEHPGVFATEEATSHCWRCDRDVPREEL